MTTLWRFIKRPIDQGEGGQITLDHNAVGLSSGPLAAQILSRYTIYRSHAVRILRTGKETTGDWPVAWKAVPNNMTEFFGTLEQRLTNKELLLSEALIGGVWSTNSWSGERFDVLNPSTGDILAKLPDMGVEETRRAIDVAYLAQKDWAARSGLRFFANGMI